MSTLIYSLTQEVTYNKEGNEAIEGVNAVSVDEGCKGEGLRIEGCWMLALSSDESGLFAQRGDCGDTKICIRVLPTEIVRGIIFLTHNLVSGNTNKPHKHRAIARSGPEDPPHLLLEIACWSGLSSRRETLVQSPYFVECLSHHRLACIS